MLKQLLWIPLFLFLPLSDGAGQENTPPAGRSIALLLDLSYSMRLPATAAGTTRLEAARQAVWRLLRAGEREDEWALLTFSGPGTTRVIQPFTRDARRVARLLPALRADGTTSPGEALEAGADYLARDGRRPDRLLVLLSDCRPTEGAWPSADRLLERRIRLLVLGFPVEGSPEGLVPAARLAETTGGALRLLPEVARSGGEHLLPEAPSAVPEAQAAATGGAEPAIPAPWLPTAMLAAQGALALLTLLVAASMTGKILRWRRARRGAGGAGPEGGAVRRLLLSVSADGGPRRSYRFDRLPLRVGPGSRCDLRLSPPGQGPRPRPHRPAASSPPGDVSPAGRVAMGRPLQSWFEIRDRGSDARLVAAAPLLINGVLRREKVLRPGDRISCGGYRIALEKVILSVASPAAPAASRVRPPRRPDLAVELGYSLFLLAIGLILALLFPPGLRARQAGAPLPPPAPVEAVEAPAATPGPPAYPAAVAEAAVIPRAPVTEDAPPPGPDPLQVEMVPPGEEPVYQPADILLFHAHPDDESLDYGGLMARASRAGLRVVTVLFCDGEGGQDRWPERGAGGIYPARRLRGKTLALVRVQETRRALAELGARIYVRLGRKNHAYDSAAQALGMRQTLADWGGEEVLTARVRRLIEGYRPAVVIAPDGPSAAREHFEHEAVGAVVARAVAEVRRARRVPLKGFLVPVDPLQRSRYPRAIGLPVDGEGGREIQARALRQHQTQRAAAVVGLEVLAGLPREYYQVVFWSGPATLDEYLRP